MSQSQELEKLAKEFRKESELVVEQDGRKFFATSYLAKESGYDQDHIGLLIRQGKIKGVRAGKKWFALPESLKEYRKRVEEQKRENALKNVTIPRRPKAPSTALSQTADRAVRSYFRTAFKTGLRYALPALFVFVVSSSLFAFAKNDGLRNSLKDLGNAISELAREFADIITPSLKFTYENKALTFRLGEDKFLNFAKLQDDIDFALRDFQTLSQNYSASIYDQYVSPVLSPVTNILGRLFGRKTQDTAQLENQIKELGRQLEEARLEISGNKQVLEEKLKQTKIVKETEVITQVGEKQIVTERRVVSIPSNVEARILAVEQYVKDGEEKFRSIELALSSVNNRFSYTPTILIPSSGGGSGHQGVTVSNPATTDSETVKVSNLLDVTGDAKIAKSLNVDSGTFYVNPTDNRVGVNTISLETALEVVGTASISGDLSLGGALTITGGTTFSKNASVSGNFEVGTNKFYVDSTNGRVGINTQNLSQALEVSGTASVSSDLFVLGNTGIGTSNLSEKLEIVGTASISNNLFALNGIGINTTSLTSGFRLDVVGSGTFSGQIRTTYSPGPHTGAWDSFGGTANSSLYVNPSTAVADSNLLVLAVGDSSKFVVDSEGDVFAKSLTLTGTTTQSTTKVTGNLTVEGNSILGDAQTDEIKLTGVVKPFSLTTFPLLIKASASQQVDLFRITDSSDRIVFTLDQGTGLLTASSGFNFALGGSTATVSYSRLGTNTTSYSNNLSRFNDFLISGNLEVDDKTFLDSTLEIQGTASASYLLTGNTLQVGGFASAAYSRFGTATTGYSSDIDTTNDLLISGALEVDGNVFLDGKASISGNFQTGGRFILGDSGDTGEINTSDWDISSTGNLSGIGTIAADGAYTQTGTGANTFSGATTFSAASTALTVDNNATITGRLGIGTIPTTKLEIQGTASASYLLTGNTLQVGGFASAAYSRFGTNTTNYSRLSDANDLLITDDLEVDGTTWFDGTVNFSGISSSSLFYAQPGTAASPSFAFAIDQDTGMFRRAVNALGFSTLGAERLTIDSGGNVGIGTTGPGTLLHINKDDASTNTALALLRLERTTSGNGATGIGSRIEFYTDNDSGVSTAIAFQDAIYTAAGNDRSGFVWSTRIGAAAAERMRLDGGNLVIGTDNALSARLRGHSETPPQIIASGDPAIGAIGFNSGGTTTGPTIGTSANFLSFYTGGTGTFSTTERVRIDSAGNVGIGTTTPTSLLTVQGRGEFQGTASASYLLTGNTLQVGGFASAAYSRFGTSTTGHSNYISDSNDLLVSGDIEVDGSISAQFASASQMFISNPTASASLTFRGNGSGGTNQSIFSIGVGNGTERLNIFKNDSSPFVTIASSGNVGIGTTSPATHLEITTSAGTSANIRATSYGTSIRSIINLANARGTASNPTPPQQDDVLGQLTFMGYDTSFGSSAGILGYAAAEHGTAGDTSDVPGYLTFFTVPDGSGTFAERMRIESAGNIGIGTTAPVSLLDLSSTTGGIFTARRVDTTVTADDTVGKLQFYAADTSTTTNFVVADIEAQATNTISTDINPGRLIFRTTSTGVAATPTERMRITETGRIGINTTTPQTLFEVQGTASASYLYSVNTLQIGAGVASVAYNRFGSTATTHANYISASNDLLISGDLATIGTVSFGGVASISGKVFLLGLGAVTDNRSVCANATSGELEFVDGVCGTSSARFKENIISLDSALESILKLNPVYYNYLADSELASDSAISESGRTKRRIGFIAEEMEAIFPEAVKYGADGLPEGIDYPNLTAVLTQAVQELDLKVASLSAKNDELGSGVIFDLDILFNSIVKKFYEAMNIVFEQGLVKVAQVIVDKITAKEVAAEKLCIGQTCVTEQELKTLLEQGGIQAQSTPEPTQYPEPSPTESPTPAPSESPAPEPMPEPSPEPTPSLNESPTPTPEPEPSPTPEPTPEIR